MWMHLVDSTCLGLDPYYVQSNCGPTFPLFKWTRQSKLFSTISQWWMTRSVIIYCLKNACNQFKNAL